MINNIIKQSTNFFQSIFKAALIVIRLPLHWVKTYLSLMLFC